MCYYSHDQSPFCHLNSQGPITLWAFGLQKLPLILVWPSLLCEKQSCNFIKLVCVPWPIYFLFGVACCLFSSESQRSREQLVRDLCKGWVLLNLNHWCIKSSLRNSMGKLPAQHKHRSVQMLFWVFLVLKSCWLN